MKQGNWTAIDKALIYLMPKDRPYSIPEAMISLSVDLDNGKDPSINGYAKLWGWSRNKVRKFVTELRTGRGHLADSKGTYKGHLITLKINGFREDEDSQGTVRGQSRDSKRDTTIKTKTKTKTKKDIYGEFKNIFLAAKEYKKLLAKYNTNCDDMIERMSQHIETKTKDPYKNHYAAILKNEDWLIKKKNNNGGKPSGKHTGLNEKDYSEGIGEDGSF